MHPCFLMALLSLSNPKEINILVYFHSSNVKSFLESCSLMFPWNFGWYTAEKEKSRLRVKSKEITYSEFTYRACFIWGMWIRKGNYFAKTVPPDCRNSLIYFKQFQSIYHVFLISEICPFAVRQPSLEKLLCEAFIFSNPFE